MVKNLDNNLEIKIQYKEEKSLLESYYDNKVQQINIMNNYLEVQLEDKKRTILLNDIKRKPTLLFPTENFRRNEHVSYRINNINLHFFIDNRGNLKVTRNLNRILKIRQKLLSFKIFNKMYFVGIASNIKDRYKESDVVRINDQIYTNIYRPFKMKKLKHIAFFKVDIKDILTTGKVHNHLYIGTKQTKGIPVRVIHFKQYRYSKFNENIIIIRKSFNNNNIIFTNIKNFPEYSFLNKSLDKIGF